jgi:preprotein translocase subunit SecG
MIYLLYLIIVMLCLIIGLLVYMQSRERKDLCNRIMAKDLREYQMPDIPRSKPGNFIKTAMKKQNEARKEM